jgi:hypothetical protein
MDFSQAESEYRRLKDRYIAAEISGRMFEEMVNSLFVQDAAGHIWQIGVNTGSWYRNYQNKWIMDWPQANWSRTPDTGPADSFSAGKGEQNLLFERHASAPEKLDLPEMVAAPRKKKKPSWMPSNQTLVMITVLLLVILVYLLYLKR